MLNGHKEGHDGNCFKRWSEWELHFKGVYTGSDAVNIIYFKFKNIKKSIMD